MTSRTAVATKVSPGDADLGGAIISRWKPTKVLACQTLGVTEDDGCLVLLNKSGGEWHPMTHLPLNALPDLAAFAETL